MGATQVQTSIFGTSRLNFWNAFETVFWMHEGGGAQDTNMSHRSRRGRDSPIYVQGSPVRRNTFSQRELFLATTAAFFSHAPSVAQMPQTDNACKRKRTKSHPSEAASRLENNPQAPSNLSEDGGAPEIATQLWRGQDLTTGDERRETESKVGGALGGGLIRYSAARRMAAAQRSLSPACRSS